jgi:GTP-binding protein
MKARAAAFMTAAAQPGQFPPGDLPEIAFAGRSNVGKSSLINTLVGQTGLARTSRTPGRTRLLNWFRVEPPTGPPVAFVDLPGYGYAKVTRDLRESWRPLVESYLGDRPALRAVVLLVDARRGAEQEEIDLARWLADAEVPVIPVLTKVDKLTKSHRKPAALAVQRALELPRAPLVFSSPERLGVDELWRAIRTAA